MAIILMVLCAIIVCVKSYMYMYITFHSPVQRGCFMTVYFPLLFLQCTWYYHDRSHRTSCYCCRDEVVVYV